MMTIIAIVVALCLIFGWRVTFSAFAFLGCCVLFIGLCLV